MSKKKSEKNKNELQVASVRLFKEDVTALKVIADERGTKWPVELRLLVRRALKGRNLKMLEV